LSSAPAGDAIINRSRDRSSADRRRPVMKHARRLFIGAVLGCLAGASVLAHEVTYKGTVVSIRTGTIVKIVVNVINEKTKKAAVMTFDVDDETKILRGDVVVTFAAADIHKDEAIAVTVNLDDSETLADVIRLSAKK
jgi:hypothetical protein